MKHLKTMALLPQLAVLSLSIILKVPSSFGSEVCRQSLKVLEQGKNSTKVSPSLLSQEGETREHFVTLLLQKMTLREKIGQLTQFSGDMDQTGAAIRKDYQKDIRAGSVGSMLNVFTPKYTKELQRIALEETRLGIPLLFGYDVIHGHRTIFPIPLGEASSWNLNLMQKTASIAAKEAAADGIHWVFAPMVDVSRDPRWGRVAEGAGEDPWLGSEIACAKVKGFQGTNLCNPNKVLATMKHFALYGAVSGGRDYNTVDMSRRSMLETYFPPYEAAAKAGVATVMTSFNEVDGVPATANQWLLKDILRDQWGFDGLVVTDYTAINEMLNHGSAENLQEAAKQAIDATVDMDMQGAAFHEHLEKLVQEGKVSEAQIDQAVRRILNAKYDLGLFHDPYRKVSEKRAQQTYMQPAHRELARQAARESIVLLKNNNSLLPLKPGSRIALIGPFAQNKRDLIGNWSAAGNWKAAVSIAEGLSEKQSHHFDLQFQKGANIIDDPDLLERLNAEGALIDIDPRAPEQMLKDAVALAETSDIIVAVLGESQAMSGEAASRADIGLPENQQILLKALVATKKPVVLILMNGRPLTLSWEDKNVDAILETWFLGTEAGRAIADVLVGDYNPSGKLTMSFPRHVGQIPVYYASKTTGRPMDPKVKYTSKYLDVPNSPLYPFGYGLSYTEFKYGPMRLNRTTLKTTDKLKVAVPITNSGERAGDEIVQLYIQDVVASVTRPVIELRRFKKIHLAPGETKTVEFELNHEDLKFYNQKLEKVSEAGEFKVMVGTNSDQLQELSFYLKED